VRRRSRALVFAGGLLALVQAPAPTRIVHFDAPATLPDRSQPADCRPSAAAGFRTDAFACTAGAKDYDPCFETARSGTLLCDVDPRVASSGTLVKWTPPEAAPSDTRGPVTRAWFFELPDGTTCRPVTGDRREIAGLTEIYTCRFALPGEADAVLGELDASTPVWTIQQVGLNKKVEPVTIKSLLAAPVKTVWR
jgi:hypothetical protein